MEMGWCSTITVPKSIRWQQRQFYHDCFTILYRIDLLLFRHSVSVQYKSMSKRVLRVVAIDVKLYWLSRIHHIVSLSVACKCRHMWRWLFYFTATGAGDRYSLGCWQDSGCRPVSGVLLDTQNRQQVRAKVVATPMNWISNPMACREEVCLS